MPLTAQSPRLVRRDEPLAARVLRALNSQLDESLWVQTNFACSFIWFRIHFARLVVRWRWSSGDSERDRQCCRFVDFVDSPTLFVHFVQKFCSILFNNPVQQFRSAIRFARLYGLAANLAGQCEGGFGAFWDCNSLCNFCCSFSGFSRSDFVV